MFTEDQQRRIYHCSWANSDVYAAIAFWKSGEVELEEAVVMAIEALVKGQDIMAKAFAFTAEQQGWKGGKGTYSQ